MKHNRLNVTDTCVPQLNAETQEASFSIDGSIYDSQQKTSHVGPVTARAKQVESFAGN